MRGFTLIELSIVLVIIGLIVGGLLVGRDLISAAAVRSQIAQIEKYRQAVATFRGKYGNLPGDIPSTDATLFGFNSRGSSLGPGNGIIKGIDQYGNACNQCPANGETGLFWVDLSAAKLIDGSFSTATYSALPTFTFATVLLYFPTAKIGASTQNSYPSIYVWSSTAGVNYFGFMSLNYISNGELPAVKSPLTVAQAYTIDIKMDDGLPQTGNVIAVFTEIGGFAYWTSANDSFVNNSLDGYTDAVSASTTTCYDNNGAAGEKQQYSISQTGGRANCGLSFKLLP